MGIGCGEEVNSNYCDDRCNDSEIIKRYNSQIGQIRKVEIGPDSQGESFLVYIIQSIENEILVPSTGISADLKIDSLRILFSGNQFECCDLLTQPYYRTSYGCKFEITSITPLIESE